MIKFKLYNSQPQLTYHLDPGILPLCNFIHLLSSTLSIILNPQIIIMYRVTMFIELDNLTDRCKSDTRWQACLAMHAIKFVTRQSCHNSNVVMVSEVNMATLIGARIFNNELLTAEVRILVWTQFFFLHFYLIQFQQV